MTREEAISVLKETIDPNVYKSFKEWKEWDKEKHLPAVKMAIEALQAEPMKGEWINTAPSDRSDNIICDQCGYNSIARYDFCPTCGAKMKGQEK